MLAPYKEEELYFSPKIVLFQDFLSDFDIEVIKSLSLSTFLMGEARDAKTGQSLATSYKIEKSAVVEKKMHLSIKNIYQRVEDITGLNMKMHESMVSQNYWIGGHYELHHDWATCGTDKDGNAQQCEDTFKGGDNLATWFSWVSGFFWNVIAHVQLAANFFGLLLKRHALSFWKFQGTLTVKS